MNMLNTQQGRVVGNDYTSDESLGFKNEVKGVFESYASQSVNLSTDYGQIIQNPETRQEFVGNLMESLTASPLFTSGDCANAPFYNNYVDRLEQLEQNSIQATAIESAMLGYAPIVAYNPFFLKKQWISCIFKDVLMTEVPTSSVINLAFEKRYVKTQDGKEYEIPDVFYNKDLMEKLTDESTGLKIKEEPIALTATKNLNILTSTYVDGLVTGDATAELTQNIHIAAVVLADADDSGKEYTVPTNIRVDITTHNFVKGAVKYDVKNESNEVVRTLKDELIGKVDFQAGTVTVVSTTGVATKIVLAGNLANRFNQRSLTVERRVEPLQYTMPESGPRLNTPVTIEEAADAMVLQKIDMVADNVDMMGSTLANLEDFEIRNFLNKSFEAQKEANVGPHGFEKLIVESSFNALPYDTFTNNVSDWTRDSREYFERMIEAVKGKLKLEKVAIVAVAHPSLVRYLNGGIKWVFSGDTTVSGVKLDYNFGVYTTTQDKVHIITTRYMDEDEGIRLLVIPLDPSMITYKHYKYSVVIDRNYRDPIKSLVPNIMCTHRTLTMEVLPVQGSMKITGRDLMSPETLKRS